MQGQIYLTFSKSPANVKKFLFYLKKNLHLFPTFKKSGPTTIKIKLKTSKKVPK